MKNLVFAAMSLLVSMTSTKAQSNTGSLQGTIPRPPVISQCFHEGYWYPSGTMIASGRVGKWCYGSYCDIDGKIKYWNDFNCPLPNAAQVAAPPFPSIEALLKSFTKPKPTTPKPTTTTTTTPAPTPRPTLFPYVVTTPPTTQQSFGCFSRGKFFWPGEDISNIRRGRRCFGSYCDWNSNIQVWEDDCRYVMPPRPTATVDYT